MNTLIKPVIDEIDRQIASFSASSNAMLRTLANTRRSKKLDRQKKQLEESTRVVIEGLQSIRSEILQLPATPAQSENVRNWLKGAELALRAYLGFQQG